MQFSHSLKPIFCAASLLAGIAAQSASAQQAWSGFYAGVNIDASRTTASIDGTAAHDRKTQTAHLGGFAGFNRVSSQGLIWGGEIGLSTLSKGATTTGGGLGTTDFAGRFVVNPRLRAGFGTDKVFVYGTVGAALTDAVIRPAGATGKELAVGISYGIGAEMAIGGGWSTRIDYTRMDVGLPNASFGAATRDTKVKMDTITLGLTRKF